MLLNALKLCRRLERRLLSTTTAVSMSVQLTVVTTIHKLHITKILSFILWRQVAGNRASLPQSETQHTAPSVESSTRNLCTRVFAAQTEVEINNIYRIRYYSWTGITNFLYKKTNVKAYSTQYCLLLSQNVQENGNMQNPRKQSCIK